MNVDWIIALVNAAIVAAFGTFLMWRTHVSVARRMAALQTDSAATTDAAVRREKQRRLVELRAEIHRLEQELGGSAHASATGSNAV